MDIIIKRMKRYFWFVTGVNIFAILTFSAIVCPNLIAAENMEIADLEGLEIASPRSDQTYGAIFLFDDTEGAVSSWGLIYDNENTFFDMYEGSGQVRLRSIMLSGYSTQAGDNILLTYDGGEQKRVYLPPLTGYNELYVASDGSTYFDRWLCQTAQVALPPSPTPSTTASPSPTPEGYLTPSPSPTPSLTPGGYRTPTPILTPTTTPVCYCCPDFSGSAVILTDQAPTENALWHYYACPCVGIDKMSWWTESTSSWVEILPGRGPGWNDYQIFVARGDTSSLSPGPHEAVISFHESFCGMTNDVHVYYTRPTPVRTATPEFTPTPSPTSASPIPTLTPICLPCAPYLETRQISLTDRTAWATATYVCMWCCNYTCCCDWTVSSSPDWLTVDPSSGSGIDPTTYTITISLDDTSSLPPGENRAVVGFACTSSGYWPVDYLEVIYYKDPGTVSVRDGDYDGDGSSEIAIFRPSSGLWAVRGITRAYFGRDSDIPVSGDYRGGGTTDMGVFRPGAGLWAVRGLTRAYFGGSSDRAAPGDYDGDGSCDMGLFRESSGLWSIREFTRVYFGETDDLPLPGDYDGDGTEDIAFFRGSSGMWAIKGISRIYYGKSGDDPVPGDYNDSGSWRPGIFRSSSGLWAIRDVTGIYFGASIDRPVPSDYNGDGSDDIGIFRETSGLWAIRGMTGVYYGAPADIPATR